jgi:putative pyruvate formate lyase activating enzyme
LAGSRDSLAWLVRDVSPRITVSIMSQYYPTHLSLHFPELRRTISSSEYTEVIKLVESLGLENGWIQEMGATENYLPHFENAGHPFSLENQGN